MPRVFSIKIVKFMLNFSRLRVYIHKLKLGSTMHGQGFGRRGPAINQAIFNWPEKEVFISLKLAQHFDFGF